MRSLNTVKGKLLIAFTSFTLIIIFLVGSAYMYIQKGELIDVRKDNLYLINSTTRHLFKLDQEYLYYGLKSDDTFSDKKPNQSTAKRDAIATDLIYKLETQRTYETMGKSGLDESIERLASNIASYNIKLNEFSEMLYERGGTDRGVILKLNSLASELEKNHAPLSIGEIIKLRNLEKDYHMGDKGSVSDFNLLCQNLSEKLLTSRSLEKIQANKLIKEYQEAFNRVVALDERMGVSTGRGIQNDLFTLQEAILNEFDQLILLVKKENDAHQREEKLVLTISAIYGILLSLWLSYFTASRISEPFKILSDIVDSSKNLKLDKKKVKKLKRSTEEVRIMAASFENMLHELSVQIALINEKSEALEIHNKKLQESEIRLNESNKVKDKFFSILAHDLRGPFATIHSFLQILVNYSDGFTKEEIKKVAKDMSLTIDGLNVLLENLLEWSRSQMGHIVFSPAPLNIKEVADNNIQVIKSRALDKHITLESSIEEDIRMVADVNMIDFIFRNLLSNAIKFTNRNGTVRVMVKDNDESIEIQVSDNGVGINPEDQQKLFQKDIQFSKMGTNYEKGTGLGLILCKEFIDKHSGSITIDSQPGQGTTFKIHLPVQPCQKNLEPAHVIDC